MEMKFIGKNVVRRIIKSFSTNICSNGNTGIRQVGVLRAS